MTETFRRYTSKDEDSARWAGFPFRDGDIVISTRSKSGTTWTQMICALLILGTPELPAPLNDLSPWLDHLVEPRDAVLARLEAQRHRRFVKTHTPLDGIPLDDRATYLVVFRHPLDAAVSLYHQSANIDRKRLSELTGVDQSRRAQPPLREWLLAWIDDDSDPRESMDSLPGFLLHLRDAWRRRERSNVVLLHYADLAADLSGQMRLLADLLGIAVPAADWDRLVDAATFERMRNRHEQLIPNRSGILKDGGAFFRRGRSGAARELLSDDEFGRYERRVAEQAPSEALKWLHRLPVSSAA